ncbi:MAG TPA: hypothetical protein VMP11_11460 [Verrucomicrobiae bacterium]|nr:hypothetical protein [Verrucomicrobiae bacterium]
MRILPRTYKHRCPGGSTKIVYRRVEDAFPLHLPGWKSKIQGSASLPGRGKGEIKSEQETKVEGLLMGLDDLNKDLLLRFRGAYIAYQSDPCAGHEFLLREVAKLLDEQQRLLRLRLQIDGLINLVKSGKGNNEFLNLYQKIVYQIGGAPSIEAAVAEVKQNADEAKKWIKGPDAG